MKNGFLSFVLGILKDRAAGVVRFARKIFDSIGSLFSGARSLLRPLLKRVVTFVVSKVAPVATRVQNGAKSSLERLRKMAEAALAEQAAEAEVAGNEAEIAPDSVIDVEAEQVLVVEQDAEVAPAPSVPVVEGSPIFARAAEPIGAVDCGTSEPTSTDCAAAPSAKVSEKPAKSGTSAPNNTASIAPALRALARVLVRPRTVRRRGGEPDLATSAP